MSTEAIHTTPTAPPTLWQEPSPAQPAAWERPAPAPAAQPAQAAQAAAAVAWGQPAPVAPTAPYQGVVAPPATPYAQRPIAGPAHPLEVASLGRRLAAYLLDVILLVVVGGLLAAGINAVLGLTATAGRGDGGVASVLAGLAYVLLISSIQFAYFATAALQRGRGQTLGKRALGIRFVHTDGSAATTGLALRRAAALIGPSAVVGAIVTLANTSAAFAPVAVLGMFLVVAYPIADYLVAPLVGVGRQTIHDRMARTVVVNAGTADAVPSTAPATITGRARTASTWAFSGTVAVAIVVLFLLIAALAAIGARAAAEYDGLQTAPDTTESYDAPFSYSSYQAPTAG